MSRVWSALWAASALAGCTQVFDISPTELDTRLDRDGDGVADSEDECIAPPEDLLGDLDGDGLANGDDPCALAQDNRDMDGDGLGNKCDPQAGMLGDRHVCLMAFSSLELNASLWKPRTGEAEFAVASGSIIGFASTPPKCAVVGFACPSSAFRAPTGSMLK